MIKEKNFKFCPACGSDFQKIDETLLLCQKCNLHYYLNPKPTNAILLQNEKSEYLFVTRAFEPKKGMLDLPGGFLNQDESVEESLKREVKEELGINLKDFKYETSSSDIYEFNNFESRTICLLFSGKLPKNAKIKPADDVADYIFYKKESIPFEKIAFKSLSDGIKQILGI